MKIINLKSAHIELGMFVNFCLFTQLSDTEMEKNEEPPPMYRLVLAGDAGAGKSSFMLRLTLNEFKGDIQTTLGGCHSNMSHSANHRRVLDSGHLNRPFRSQELISK